MQAHLVCRNALVTPSPLELEGHSVFVHNSTPRARGTDPAWEGDVHPLEIDKVVHPKRHGGDGGEEDPESI